MRTADVARVAHEINRAYCNAIGDTSQPAWEDAPEWQRSSAEKGVAFIVANPDAAPSASHESWLEQKRADGWKYGPVKDPEKLEHPCFVPYDELPAEQRVKDHLFGAVVRSLTRELEVVPAPIEIVDHRNDPDFCQLHDVHHEDGTICPAPTLPAAR